MNGARKLIGIPVLTLKILQTAWKFVLLVLILSIDSGLKHKPRFTFHLQHFQFQLHFIEVSPPIINEGYKTISCVTFNLVYIFIYFLVSAIDMTSDIYSALENVIALGCKRVLTSGGENTALEGAHALQKWLSKPMVE